MNAENPFQAKNVNLNTIVAIVSFLGVFASFVATWTIIQTKQTEISNWQFDHLKLHEQLSIDRAARTAAVNVRLDTMQDSLNELEQMKYRITLNEKAIDTTDTRIDRVVESYANQFNEIRSQLAVLNTQLALANDSLKRLEKVDRLSLGTPKELRSQ